MRGTWVEHPAPLNECNYSHGYVEANEHITGSRLRFNLSLAVRYEKDHYDVRQCENEAAKPHNVIKLFTDVGAIFVLTTPLNSEIRGIIAEVVV